MVKKKIINKKLKIKLNKFKFNSNIMVIIILLAIITYLFLTQGILGQDQDIILGYETITTTSFCGSSLSVVDNNTDTFIERCNHPSNVLIEYNVTGLQIEQVNMTYKTSVGSGYISFLCLDNMGDSVNIIDSTITDSMILLPTECYDNNDKISIIINPNGGMTQRIYEVQLIGTVRQ